MRGQASGAEDADVAYDLGFGREQKRKRKKKSGGSVSFRPSGDVLADFDTFAEELVKMPLTVYHPENDSEAKAIIERLGHFEWDTMQVKGRFDRNPYSLHANIRGTKCVIKIKGRFGGVMRWLDLRERQEGALGKLVSQQ